MVSSDRVIRSIQRRSAGFQTWTVGHPIAEMDFLCRWRRGVEGRSTGASNQGSASGWI